LARAAVETSTSNRKGGSLVGELTGGQNRARTAGGSEPAVEAEGLVKTYRGRDGTVEAVRGVDLRVDAGEVFGFLGPNGAGKSTTVRMLTTLLSITSGTARVAGLDVAHEPDAVRRRIGVALQEAGLDARQTGRELLVLQGRLFDLSAHESSERAAELLELVELSDAADRRIKGYSGGMKRRLDLASALVHEPEVLFLDEPTTGLDPASRLTVWDEVRRINERGTTVFLTTQYLEEADQLCDRLAIIDDGLIVREGTPPRLKAELRERLGLAREATLDEVFLDATGRTRTHVAGEVQEVLG
jgi:ABC-2 type transport system ATP-binding protein